MKVTIRYMDDSVSTLDIEEAITVNTSDEYFTLDDENENIVGWIVRENVKYIVLGELVDNFKDVKKGESEKDDKDPIDKRGSW